MALNGAVPRSCAGRGCVELDNQCEFGLGLGTNHPDHENAIGAAKKWVDAEQKRQGLPLAEYEHLN